jgi:hypothetical protein
MMFGEKMRRRHAVLLAVTALGLACMAGPAAGAATNAEVPAAGAKGTSAAYLASVDPAVLANQDALMDYKSWLIGVPGINGAGYVESANYRETKSTTLLWAGTSPLQATVLAEAARRGITATITPVKYSRAQLQAGIDKLLASKKDTAWNGFEVTSIRATDLTHDGLSVRGHYRNTPNAAVSDTKKAVTLQAAKGLSSLVTDIAVISEPALATLTRSTDFAPFNAGGLIRGANNTGCSSGFAVMRGGLPWTITARHCHSTPYSAWDAPNNSYGGTVATTSNGARLLTADGIQQMFDGGWNDPNGYAKSVTGYADPSLYDPVCTSGANSGVHCNIQVDSTWVTFDDGYGSFPTIEGTQRTGDIAAAQGDSGGPVFVPHTDNITVGAAGMIQGVSNQSICNPPQVHLGGVSCGQRVLWTSERAITAELNATLKTG